METSSIVERPSEGKQHIREQAVDGHLYVGSVY
jgi:hypothetical protein